MTNQANPPSEPSALKLDGKTLGLWEALRAAVEAEADWLDLRADVRRLVARVDGVERRRQPALTSAFRCVQPHLTALGEEWDNQREVIKLHLQDLAWEFSTHAFGLQDDNRVVYTDGRVQTMTAERLLCTSFKLGDLALRGHHLKEDGSPGQACWISLLRTAWSKALPQGLAGIPPR